MTYQFALLGAGRIGRVHAKTLAALPNGTLRAVADSNLDAAKALTDDFGGTVRAIDDIAADANIDAVLICTPTNTHADLIEKFARAGKAIFCEKPIDLTPARVRSCLDVVTAHNARLMVGFNRRFDPQFLALKDAIDTGQIGAVEMITITSRDPCPPPADYIKTSGGIFKDMTIHDFDMARFLLGEEIETVMARGSVLVDRKIAGLGDYDSANVILTTASGKHCAISNSRRATYGYDQRIEVLGALGLVSAQNQRPVSIELATAHGFTKPPLFDFFMTRYEAAYEGEITAFVASLGDASPVQPDGSDGLAALLIAEAAMLCVQENRAVNLSELCEGSSPAEGGIVS